MRDAPCPTDVMQQNQSVRIPAADKFYLSGSALNHFNPALKKFIPDLNRFESGFNPFKSAQQTFKSALNPFKPRLKGFAEMINARNRAFRKFKF